MLAVNPLPPEEILTLEELHKNHPCHAPRIRAHAILLSDNGFKLAKIASIFNICRQTAETWLHAWKDGGICALFDKPRSGRPTILRAVKFSVFYIPEGPVYMSFAEGITENLTARSIFCATKPKLMRLHVSINRPDH